MLVFCVLAVQCRCAPTVTVCIRDACLRAEVADTLQARIRGLMFRKSLSEDEGMLFVFEESARHSFWMKNMSFPLDIIWISADKTVVDIARNVTPCVEDCPALVPRLPSRYVLEVSAGFATRHRVEVGDRVRF